MPGLPLASWFKILLIIVALVAPFVWAFGFAAYYALGVGPSMYIMPLAEIALLLVLLRVALVASGIRVPGITAPEAKPGRFDVLSDVTVPSRIFIVPTIVAVLGVLVGFFLAAAFRAAHKPIEPAALVQLHTHTILIAASSVIMLLALRAMNVNERFFNLAIRISQIAVPLVFLGLLAFNIFKLHSIVWVIPSAIYFILPLSVFLTAIGLISRAGEPSLAFAPATRMSIAFASLVLIVLIATGAYIALKWDTSPDVTITFKQKEWPFVGPYPDPAMGYPGTAPVRNTPRGLETAHYSPGSWLHVAIAWIIALALISRIFYLLAITVPIAPFFNALGRYLAWAPPIGPAAPALMVPDPLFKAAPPGAGALLYAGHPFKAFNIIALFILGIALLYIMSKTKETR
ncbi:MAG: hypothetical protein P3X22_003865 [Thermoprotei archaeon]|nr:hypothetical protein [Thermoprotei archaeon]